MSKCNNCFYKWKYKGIDYCKIIENEGGGSIEADKEECDLYLKKGTEPQWLCSVCGKNTWGESSVSTGGKHYCDNCNWRREKEEIDRKRKIKIKKLEELVGKEKSKEVVSLFNL